MIGQLGELPPVTVKFNIRLPRGVLTFACVVLGMVVLLGATAMISIMEAIAPAIAVLALAAMTSSGAYRLAPEVRAKYGARRELSAQRKEANKAFRTVDNLDKERASNDEDERRKAEGIQRQQAEAVLNERKDLQKAEQRMQSALRKHAEKRAGIASQEQKERATALARIQQDFMHSDLMRYSIS